MTNKLIIFHFCVFFFLTFQSAQEIPNAGRRRSFESGMNFIKPDDFRDQGMEMGGHNMGFGKGGPGMRGPGMGMDGPGMGMGGPGMGMGGPGMGMGGPGMGMGGPGGRRDRRPGGMSGHGIDQPEIITDSNSTMCKFFINKAKIKSFFYSVYEIVMFGFLILFLFNCFFGNEKNDNYSLTWYNANKDFFFKNYSYIGDHGNNSKQKIIKENENSYKVIARGRLNIKWALINLDFKKKKDIISFLKNIFISREKDKINFEFALDLEEELPTVFCICKKKDVIHFKKENIDIEYFTKAYDSDYISKKNIVLAENFNIVSNIFKNDDILKLYKKVEEFVDVIYYTDKRTFSKEKHAIHISFEIDLTKSGLEEKFRNITYFSHLFVDYLADFELTQENIKDAEILRAGYEKYKQKEVDSETIQKIETKDIEEEPESEQVINRNRNKKKKK